MVGLALGGTLNYHWFSNCRKFNRLVAVPTGRNVLFRVHRVVNDNLHSVNKAIQCLLHDLTEDGSPVLVLTSQLDPMNFDCAVDSNCRVAINVAGTGYRHIHE